MLPLRLGCRLPGSNGAVPRQLTSRKLPCVRKLVTRDEFEHLASLPAAEARARLARLVAGTVLAPLVPEHTTATDEAMLTAQLRELRRTVRLDPLSLGVVLDYVLRLRAELEDLARIIWGITLRVPRRRISAGLVTP